MGLCAYLQMRSNTVTGYTYFVNVTRQPALRWWFGRSDLDFCSKAQPDLSSNIKGVCGHDSHYLSDGNDTGPVGRGRWGLLVCTLLTAPSPAGSRLHLVLACNDGEVGGAGLLPHVRTWVIAPTLILSGTNPASPHTPLSWLRITGAVHYLL